MSAPERTPLQDSTDTAARYESFREHISFLGRENADGSLNVPGDDRLKQSCFQAIDTVLGDGSNPVLENNIKTALAMDPERSDAHLGFWLLRDLQDSALRFVYPVTDYTEGFEDPNKWIEGPIRRLAEDPAEQVHFWMNFDLKTRTNFPQRGVLQKLAVMMLGYTDPIYMIDGGCARNHVAKKLAHPKRNHFPYKAVSVKHRNADGKLVNDEPYNLFVQAISDARKLPIANIVGIDIQDLLMPDTPQRQIKSLLRSIHIPEALKQYFWSRNNLYPQEYRLEQDRVFEYDLLDALQPDELPLVQFFKGDMTNFDHERYETTFPDLPKADIATLMFSGYQMGTAGVAAAVKNLKRQMKPNGKILVFDHMNVSQDGSVKFLDDWKPWTAAMAVLDLEKEENGFTELFKVKNGRATEIMLNNACSRMAVRRLMRSAH